MTNLFNLIRLLFSFNRVKIYGYSGVSNIITEVIVKIQEEQKGLGQTLKDTILPSLKMEKGAISQGLQIASKSRYS